MIELLRKLIQEELGRDLESPRPDPMDWKSFPGVHVMITADPVGGVYVAQVKVEDRDDLSTPSRRFKSENDAMFWARSKAEHAYKSLINTPGFTHDRPKFN